MTEARNGSMRLAYWIMGALFSLLTIIVGGGAATMETRINALDAVQKSRSDSMVRFEGDLRALREQVCRLEEKVDTLREDLTNKPVHRMPCP